MSVVLGINAYHPGASAALVVDGIPVSAIAEERLNRVKYFAGFPKLAIQTCLNDAGLNLSDVNIVSIGRRPTANRRQKLLYAMQNPEKAANLLKIKRSGTTQAAVKQIMSRECAVEEHKLQFDIEHVEHHLAHIASAYFISPWDKCAAISIDGSGDFVTCMMASCQGSQIEILRKVFVPHSLGSFYTTICEFIGYGKYGDEGKVMGLAPLGDNRFADLFEDMLTLTPRGIKLSSKYVLPFGANEGMAIDRYGSVNLVRHYSDHLVKYLGPPRSPQSEITQREKDLAFSLQFRFEKAYLHLMNILHKLVPDDNVAIAGGCALNSVANGMIFGHTPFVNTCIQPAAGDEGLALGSALYASNSILRSGSRWEMEHSYLGPKFSSSHIRSELKRYNVSFQSLDEHELIAHTVESIVSGEIVGWFQGRMEWGPRALGNRSILAHPGLSNMKDVLNSRIKHRESFRPFAPAVLAEHQSEIFEYSHPSPFMLHVYKIRSEWRSRLCAVNHVDDTGRLQSVSQRNNPLFYKLITHFFVKTGIPVILNTSFNENEPIVCSPSEAIECFLRTKMDAIAIGPFFCRKN